MSVGSCRGAPLSSVEWGGPLLPARYRKERGAPFRVLLFEGLAMEAFVICEGEPKTDRVVSRVCVCVCVCVCVSV